jgi:hypothetical protein
MKQTLERVRDFVIRQKENIILSNALADEAVQGSRCLRFGREDTHDTIQAFSGWMEQPFFRHINTSAGNFKCCLW